jgi:hypothetical protein
MATWPSTLKITRNNYSETRPNRSIRSSMDIGPAKLRRRSSMAIRPVTMTLFLTPEQCDILDTFYDENESLGFDFINPRTGVTERARFTREPQYSARETMWDVSIELELLP